MRLSVSKVLVLALATDVALASTWFSKAAYNKWHETELEQWLSDHDIPYPAAADRKELENLVKTNWQNAVESPYANWDTKQLQKHLEKEGQQIKKGTEKNKNELVAQVKSSWYETGEQASKAYDDVKAWIFDSWTESQLKAFLDKHGIPAPQPRTRDTLLKHSRENYETIAKKLNQAAAYPGNWLYESWSDSDLKAWLDEHGYPVPQSGKRDKLIAAVRRNSYLASKQLERSASDASDAAESAKASISEAILDTWSDSKLKELLDKNGIKVPQGSTRNEIVAIARKNFAKLTGDTITDSAASAFGAATSSAGNEYAKASSVAESKGNELFAQATNSAKHYVDKVLIAVGLKTNYVSSISRTASSAYAKASKGVRGEL